MVLRILLANDRRLNPPQEAGDERVIFLSNENPPPNVDRWMFFDHYLKAEKENQKSFGSNLSTINTMMKWFHRQGVPATTIIHKFNNLWGYLEQFKRKTTDTPSGRVQRQVYCSYKFLKTHYPISLSPRFVFWECEKKLYDTYRVNKPTQDELRYMRTALLANGISTGLSNYELMNLKIPEQLRALEQVAAPHKMIDELLEASRILHIRNIFNSNHYPKQINFDMDKDLKTDKSEREYIEIPLIFRIFALVFEEILFVLVVEKPEDIDWIVEKTNEYFVLTSISIQVVGDTLEVVNDPMANKWGDVWEYMDVEYADRKQIIRAIIHVCRLSRDKARLVINRSMDYFDTIQVMGRRRYMDRYVLKDEYHNSSQNPPTQIGVGRALL